MYIILMKLMNLSMTLIWILVGLMMAACGAYAQETGQKVRQRSESYPQDLAKVDSFENLLRDADVLIKSGKPAAAYALLEPLEFEHAGEVRFDYLIATAALESGKPALATLAFERVLAVDPVFPSARLDMAIAYYQLGDMPRAKTEFIFALKQNPSEAERTRIKHYLDEIAAREAGKSTVSAGYIEGAVGYDTNVNSSTSQSQVEIFEGGTWRVATLDPANVKVSDSYYGLAAGATVTHRHDSYWSYYAGADLRGRVNRIQKFFDIFGLNARAGILVGENANRLRIEVMGERSNLGDAPNYYSAGLNADWRRIFNPGDQLNVFAQYMQYRYYDPFMKPNDINQQAMGLGWLHYLAEGRSSISGSLYYGTEQDISPVITTNYLGTPFVVNPSGGRIDGAKRFTGVRAAGIAFINKMTSLFASAGMQVGDFSKVNSYFLRQRYDRYFDLGLGADWHWNELWSLRPQLYMFKNESNIPVYAYDRLNFSLTVRRDFR